MPVKPAAPEVESFAFDPEKHIVIALKVYERESLSEEVRNAIGHINFADQELANMDGSMRVLRIGRDRMVEMLVERIEGDGLQPVAIVPAPDGEGGNA